MSTLVLFDIDGTLIHTQQAGIRGMNAAFLRLHGMPAALEGIPVAGRTDRAIVSEALVRGGVEPSARAIAELRDAYFESLPAELARRMDGRYGVLPGVDDLLDTLHVRPHTAVGLLTGNFEAGAEIKLTHFGLWPRFGFGAFGDDHLDRRDLVPVALDRARAAGYRPARVIVIGDTPLDVDCAHAHGAIAVGVATGIYTREALATAAADFVVDTLSDLPAIGAWIDT